MLDIQLSSTLYSGRKHRVTGLRPRKRVATHSQSLFHNPADKDGGAQKANIGMVNIKLWTYNVNFIYKKHMPTLVHANDDVWRGKAQMSFSSWYCELPKRPFRADFGIFFVLKSLQESPSPPLRIETLCSLKFLSQVSSRGHEFFQKRALSSISVKAP